ncbi:MAG: methyltransferase domain-containing protein [Paracoccaceae bacterium]
MEFVGEIAEAQRRLAECRELAERRHAVLEALAPRRGQRVLELGCGGGLLLREIGFALGPHGLAAGVDISPDQIRAAAAGSVGIPAVKAAVGDVRALAYPDAVFDAAVAVQVIEYVPEVETVLAEARRVLKPGGRLLCLATNWASAFWHGPPPDLTAHVTALWDGHAAHPNLPARLAPLLSRAGFAAIRQLPVPVVNAEYGPHGFAYWLARLMTAQARAEGLPAREAEAWIAALDSSDAAGEFFFSMVPILTEATAV